MSPTPPSLRRLVPVVGDSERLSAVHPRVALVVGERRGDNILEYASARAVSW